MDMYINGVFTDGNASERIDVINPATEEVIDSVPRGTAEDLNAAVAAAKAAFDTWRKVPAFERAGFLHAAANMTQADEEELTELLTLEQGKPWIENEEEVFWTYETLRMYAEVARMDGGLFLPPGDPDQINFTIKEPYGVVGCIIPWNFPLLLLAWKIAPAIAAGNTVVIKPSEYTPLSTLRLIKLAFQDFPPGVVNVVTGYGPEVGEPLVIHSDVPMVAFTGSVKTGQKIASLAAPMMKKLHLELGGKDPLVVAPDVNIDTAVRGVAYAGLYNAGQVCTSAERVYVHDSIYGQFTEELTDFVSGLKLGPGMDRSSDIGPMMRERFRVSVENVVAETKSVGGKVLIGGKRPNDFERGFFYEPTIIVGVDHSMRIMREETFGPVIPLMPYTDFDEVIRLANDTHLGLGASLMTHDARLVKRFFQDVKAGTIWINDLLTDNFAGPFGGMKMTGGGRELGQIGYDEFVEIKHVHWDVEGKAKDYWYPYGNGDH